MYHTLRNSTGLLLAVFIAALALPFQEVSTGIITASESVTKHKELAYQLEISEKELLQLKNLTHLLHDQQMERWDASLLADGDTSWPCPDQSLLGNCVCVTSGTPLYNLDIDCSSVTNDQEIIEAFGIPFPFDDIGQLQIVSMDANTKVPITNFTQNMFDTKSFDIIKVTQTTLERIEDNVFQLSHDTLTSLTLDDNNLQLFPFEIIPEYTTLWFLHMVNNDLLELPKIQSVSLHDFNMNHNPNLVLLDEELTFVGAPALTKVRLADTNITRIPPNLFSTLEHIITIIITDNAIEELDAHAINAPGPTITTLNLARNSISTVRVGAITGMATGGTIDLSDNQVTTLEEGVWKPILDQLEDDEAFILDGNFLECGCDMNWIMINPDYKRKLSPESTCFTGDLVTGIDECFFLANCVQPVPPSI